jgi:hypothetical protein
MSQGGNQQDSGSTSRNGLPKYQNQQVRGAIGNSANTYNQGSQQVAAANPAVSGIANQGNATENYFLSGQNAYAQSNPYLQSYIQAADQPLVQNYDQAVAPNTEAAFLHAGSFGDSSAYNQAVSNNEYNLGQALSTTNANIVNPAYEQGMQQTQQAINQEPTAQGANYAAPFAQQQYQNNYNQGLMNLTQPYGYNQTNQYSPQGGFTPGQGVGGGLGLAGLANLYNNP